MAGETIVTSGSFAVVQASDSIADTEYSTGSATTIATALSTGDESDYALLDFKLDITSGTPVDGSTMALYRIPKADGTNAAPTPDNTSTYKGQYVGSFVMMDTATSFYYLFGVANEDPSATYILWNEDGGTLTAVLYARGRTYKAAA